MNSFWNNIQPVIKKETEKVTFYTGIGVALMWFLFAVLHVIFPNKVSFDLTVILGGVIGGFVAVLNFFLMGVTVQKVTLITVEEFARKKMKASYSKRMVLQMIWVIVAVAAPCFQYVAGLLPLLFPGAGIKLAGMIRK